MQIYCQNQKSEAYD